MTTVVFDKTGTLTRGRPEVTDILATGFLKRPCSPLPPEWRRTPGTLWPRQSTGWPGAGIYRSNRRNVSIRPAAKGSPRSSSREEVLVGNRTFLQEKGIAIPEGIEAAISRFEQDGKTAILIAVSGQMAGALAVADTLKETTQAAVTRLKTMGLKVVMITGDNRRTADAIARQIGIENVVAGVLPQDKAAHVRALQEKGEVVAFVGDGINDAPALAQADVGIAIGGGTDVAIESADIVLIKDNLLDSVAAIRLSKKVMGRIRGNIFWAFAYNAALIPVAAGILYPSFGITFRPELAALAMALSSVTVVSLSLLLKTYIPEAKKGNE